MKKLLGIVLISILFQPVFSQKSINWQPRHEFDSFFRETYNRHPNIRRGLLEAISWVNTRMQMISPGTHQPSCVGIPQVVGPMGLYLEDPNEAFLPMAKIMEEISSRRELLNAQFSGKPKLVGSDPEQQIEACAWFYDLVTKEKKHKQGNGNLIWEDVAYFSGIPSDGDEFARFSFLYAVEAFLNDPAMQEAYGFEPLLPSEQLIHLVGEENYRVLSAKRVTISNGQARAANGAVWSSLPEGTTSGDYPPALWDPAPSCNWSSRNGTPVSAVTIHTTQGSYSGAINWFKNCNSNVAAHYVIRSFDGQVTQMVLEADKGWHVGSENPYTIGIEHEGYVSDASWYTNEMYASSADLVRDIINSGYGIDGLKTYDGPPHTGIVTLAQNCYKIKGHQHFPNQTHTDPGINWDWARYYRMLNGAQPANVTTLTACSGTFYDGGGAGNNYGNQERKGWIISPTGASQTTLSFSAFDLESGYDYLYIYAGDSPEGELLGKFDGTSLPGPFTSASGKFYLEFRSDCATTRPGWAASWSCSTAPAACGTPSGLTESGLHATGVTLGWSSVSGATSYEVRSRHSLASGWNTWSTTNTSLELSGLAATSRYEWQVRVLCGANASNWAGDSILTPGPGNHTFTACAGTLNDAGGTIGNYRNNENYTLTLAPTGAGSVTLSFTSFDLESNYDFLYLYDGPSTASPLIGTYTGTSSPGTITSSGGTLTLKFTSDNWTTRSGWEASWTCASNLAPTTAISPINEWYADDFTANITDTDPSSAGLQKKFYQVLEYADTAWSCNRDLGFLYETFDGGFPNWTTTAGYAYILNDRLHHTDTVTTNSNNYIDVAQDNSGAWLYTFSARLWSGNTNRRFGIHFFADNPTASQRGNSYLVWFRGDNQTCEIYETVNNTLNRMVIQPITIGDFVWYDYKIVYDPATGQLKVWQENNLIASWTDSTPIQAGGYVSIRTNQAHVDYENLRAWKERGSAVNVSIGPQNNQAVRYMSPNPTVWAGQLHSYVVDNANNWSNQDFKSFKVDWTPPTDITVNDGTAQDVDTVFSSSQLAANWTTSVDTNSGIETYRIALGSSPGLDDIVAWTSMGDTTGTELTGLSLTHNTMYYVTVKSENLSGLECNPASSDGVLVWMPTTGTSDPGGAPQWTLYPNPARDHVRIQLPESAKGIRIFDAGGKMVYTGTAPAGDFSIRTADWPAGLYSVVIIFGEKSSTKKLIIQR